MPPAFNRELLAILPLEPRQAALSRPAGARHGPERVQRAAAVFSWASMRPALRVLALAALLAVSPASAADDGATSCWLVDTSAAAVVATYSGDSCPVQVLVTSSASLFAANESVPLLWELSLLSDSSNDLGMSVPPEATVTLSPDNVGELAQITATYARSCATVSECDPTVTAGSSFSSVQSGNFTGEDQDKPVFFHSVDELRFEQEGAQVISAVAMIADSADSTLAYYYAAFLEIDVASSEALSVGVYVLFWLSSVCGGLECETDELCLCREYDKESTYCREAAEDPLEDTLNAAKVAASSSSCEIAIQVTSPGATQAGAEFSIEWDAVLTRNAFGTIQLPSPLIAYDIASDSSDEDASSVYYTIVSSVVKICSGKSDCNEYSDNVNVSSATKSSNFTNNAASFTASGMVLPTTGWYSGVAQITLSGDSAGESRYDFMTYFNILATETDVAASVDTEVLASDGTSYCWEVAGSADAADIDASGVYASSSNGDCPYTVSMTANNTTVVASLSNFALQWTVEKQADYSQATFSDINTTAVYNSSTDEYVEITQVNIYICNTTSSTLTSTTCSPLSVSKTLLYSSQPTNFSSDGSATFSADNLAISVAGTYTVFAHAVIGNGEDSRVDVASFMAIEVAASSSSASSQSSDTSSSSSGMSSSTLIGIFCGCIGGILVIALVLMKVKSRWRSKRDTDDDEDPATAKSGMFGFRPLSVTNELPTASADSRHSNASDESGSFLYVKAQRSPVDEARYSSLSYDPYSRKSFTEMANEESSPRYSFVLSDREMSPAPASSIEMLSEPTTPTHHA